MEEYAYRWNREYAITTICLYGGSWALLFGFPAAIAWLTVIDDPIREPLLILGWLGLTAVVTALHTRKYWKRLWQRAPQLEFRCDGLRAVQLGDQVIPWREVAVWGEEIIGYEDSSYMSLHTPLSVIKLDISGLDVPAWRIIEQAEAMALAFANRWNPLDGRHFYPSPPSSSQSTSSSPSARV